jgi:hypothetical protein
MEKGADGAKNSVSFKPLITGINEGVYVKADNQWGGYLTVGIGSNDHFKKSASFVPHKNDDGSWWLSSNHEDPMFGDKFIATWGGSWFTNLKYYRNVDRSGDRSALIAKVVQCPA